MITATSTLTLTSIKPGAQQPPLIHIIHEDDVVLLNSENAEWFKILYYFPWQEYRIYGAMYYDALYEFNIKEAQKRKGRNLENETAITLPGSPVDIGISYVETKEEARERLLFNRVTMQNDKEKKGPIIYQANNKSNNKDKEVEVESKSPSPPSFSRVWPENISPGEVPLRVGGKKPKCFFALLKSFLGASLMGFSPEPDLVDSLLTGNPSFARVCGFFPKNSLHSPDEKEKAEEYWFKHTPGLRKLEQFDQIMREGEIWDKIKIGTVRNNIESGVVEKENVLVGDTTHYQAYSGFETVKYRDESGKEQKKSQSKITKNCRCEDKKICHHRWVLTDDGAGTIVKSNTKMYWGHKASIIGFPRQGIPLDAVAISDASTFDGETFYPHVVKVLQKLEQIKPNIDTAIYDSACDNKQLKRKFKDTLGIDLKTSFNPRGKKEVTKDLPRGMAKITPSGNVICQTGYVMDYKGMRYEHEKFIYQAPRHISGFSVCQGCQYQNQCCPNALNGRIINVSFDLLPHIDTNDPPMAKRFKAIMSQRPAVERMIKRLKCDLGDSRLTKRGNDSFQAYLDKTLIALHILIRT